jgi:hypothetical protein
MKYADRFNVYNVMGMIDFSCRCGHAFSVPDDRAGGEIQCPACGRLNDIPKLSDLAHLAADGTFELGAVPQTPSLLPDVERVFGRQKLEADGSEIDLRHPAYSDQAPSPQPQESPDDSPRPAAPRYDPETGEIIRPLDLIPAPELDRSIPVANRVLAYAVLRAEDRISWGKPLIELFSPVNMLVLFFVLIAQIMAMAVTVPLYAVLTSATVVIWPVLFLVLLVCGGGILAHLSVVIEEIGTDGRNELPRFLRNMSLSDDLWGPFVYFATAIGLCFGPILVAAALPLKENVQWSLMAGLAVLGGILFPATLLTSVTSGTTANLRPDRILRLMGVIGARYIILILAFALAAGLYLAGIAAVSGSALHWLEMTHNSGIFQGIVAWPLLIGGIYFIHYFCWVLGLEYRRHHSEYPWVMQFHVRAPPVLPAAGPPRGTRSGRRGDRRG